MRRWRIAAAALTAVAMVWVLLAAMNTVGGAAAAPARPTGAGEVVTRTVTLTPSKDNTLYESELGRVSNGMGQYFFAGTTDNGDIRRGLLAFDLSGIPDGATVLIATLAITISRTTAGGTAVALHPVAADWGEGESDAVGEEGAGATAMPGDATWVYAFFDTDQWAQPGGEFGAAASANTPINGSGAYVWASPALLADVAGWVADPATNFGWALLGDETADHTAVRFDSRENAPANRPRLTITYASEVVETQLFLPAVLKP